MQEALPIFNSNPDGGVFLISSSIGGITYKASSMAYAVTKAAGLHLMKCLASTQGPKVRVNAVLPGLLLTEWGMRYSEEKKQEYRDKAVLKEVTGLEDTADIFISTAKNTSVTGQQLVVGMS
ncbi:hypothetical protein LTS07_004516 [Exophiala sideris]|nr:hypothetical protein LTS07_004516 [Exophiala sideris]KAK5040824.1 hypothetical protein LTR13_003125 [Exophiala sideris]